MAGCGIITKLSRANNTNADQTTAHSTLKNEQRERKNRSETGRAWESPEGEAKDPGNEIECIRRETDVQAKPAKETKLDRLWLKIGSSREFLIPLSKSLILAQDERWRRA